jgi:hypothetical protein
MFGQDTTAPIERKRPLRKGFTELRKADFNAVKQNILKSKALNVVDLTNLERQAAD